VVGQPGVAVLPCRAQPRVSCGVNCAVCNVNQRQHAAQVRFATQTSKRVTNNTAATAGIVVLAVGRKKGKVV